VSFSKYIDKYRPIVLSPPLIFALWFGGESNGDYFTWPLGVAVCLVGAAIRIWAEQHINRTLPDRDRHLALTGPYKFARNPLYIGNLFLCTGAVIVSKLPWMIPLTFLWHVAVYSVVIRLEEGILLEKYGEPYRKFKSEVPRWFPKVMDSGNMELTNSYFRTAFLAEARSLSILLPYALKEIFLHL